MSWISLNKDSETYDAHPSPPHRKMMTLKSQLQLPQVQKMFGIMSFDVVLNKVEFIQ